MAMANKTTFSIGDTSKMTGVTQKQIRNWEAKGYISLAGRVLSGERAYRRFTAEQVKVIRTIKNYLDEGHTLTSAAQKSGGKFSLEKEDLLNA